MAFHTRATMLTSGFVEVPSTTNLFTHPTYPGLLYRVVTTWDEALAVGSWLVQNGQVNSSRDLHLFGETARTHYNSGFPNRFMTVTGLRMYRGKKSAGYTFPMGADMANVYGANYVGSKIGWVSNLVETNEKICAVVSKINSGYILKFQAEPSTGVIGAVNALVSSDWVNSDVKRYENSAASFSVTPFPSLGNQVNATVCGRLNFRWASNVAGYLAKQKAAVLAEVDSGVRDKAGVAFDEAIAAETSMVDEFSLFPTMVGQAVHFTASDPTKNWLLTAKDVNSTYSFIMVKTVAPAGTVNATAKQPDAFMTGYNNRIIGGFAVVGFETVDMGPSVLAAFTPTYPSNVVSGAVFPLTAIPAGQIKYSSVDHGPNGILASIGPLANVVSGTLDVSPRLGSFKTVTETVGPHYASGVAGTEQGAAQAEAIASTTGLTVDRARLYIDQALWMPPMAAAITRVSSNITLRLMGEEPYKPKITGPSGQIVV